MFISTHAFRPRERAHISVWFPLSRPIYAFEVLASQYIIQLHFALDNKWKMFFDVIFFIFGKISILPHSLLAFLLSCTRRSTGRVRAKRNKTKTETDFNIKSYHDTVKFNTVCQKLKRWQNIKINLNAYRTFIFLISFNRPSKAQHIHTTEEEKKNTQRGDNIKGNDATDFPSKIRREPPLKMFKCTWVLLLYPVGVCRTHRSFFLLFFLLLILLLLMLHEFGISAAEYSCYFFFFYYFEIMIQQSENEKVFYIWKGA